MQIHQRLVSIPTVLLLLLLSAPFLMKGESFGQAATTVPEKFGQQTQGDIMATVRESATRIEKNLGLAETSSEKKEPANATGSAQGIAGFTEAKSDIHIGLTEAGRIARINVREGTQVKAGDVLLSLDNTLEELDVKHKQLKRDQRAELGFAVQRESLTGERLQGSRRLLDAKTAISRDEFNQARIEHAQAASDVARLKSQKELENIEYSLAVERLQRRTLVAPVSGIVVHVAKSEGEIVQANEPLVRLVESTTGRFVGNADPAVGSYLAMQQPVCLRMKLAGEVITRPATVSFVSPVIDTASNLQEVKAEFANTEHPVQLGQAAILIPAVCP